MITTAQYAEILSRRAAKPSRSDSVAKTGSTQLETGKDGIQAQIEGYLKSLGKDCWYVKSRTDKATTQRPGIPDFVGVYKKTAFGIEVKQPGKKPTVEQNGELLWLDLAGAKTCIAHSLAEAIQFMEAK